MHRAFHRASHRAFHGALHVHSIVVSCRRVWHGLTDGRTDGWTGCLHEHGRHDDDDPPVLALPELVVAHVGEVVLGPVAGQGLALHELEEDHDERREACIT